MENKIDLNKFREMVVENAYYKAERKGFGSDHQIADLLKAEIAMVIRHIFLCNSNYFL